MKKINFKISYLFLSCLAISLLSSCNDSYIDNTILKLEILDDGIKKVYGRGETIDLSSTTLKVTYLNGESNIVNALDSIVDIKGVDTETVGDHKIIFSIDNASTFDTYKVEQYTVTLNYLDGTFNGNSVTTVDVYANKCDLSTYVPTKGDIDSKTNLGYKFSGWFYDEKLTSRAAYLANHEFFTDKDVTLYAGYDLNYTDRFLYRVDEDESEVELLSININALLDEDFLYSKTLSIPTTIDRYPVTSIGDDFLIYKDEDDEFNLASYLSFEAIDFGEDSHITKIGKNAFSNLISLKRLDLPKSIEEIDEKAFFNTGIENEIVFPKSLIKIGAYSFANNQCGIDKVSFEDNSKIKVIGEYAFNYCTNLTNIELVEGIEEIRDGAFANSSIEYIYIPASVKYIGNDVFKETSYLKEIVVSSFNFKYSSIDGNLYSEDLKTLIKYCYGKNETTFTLLDSVTSIGDSAFNLYDGYSGLSTLILNDKLSYIGSEAFSNCYFDMVLPSSLTSFNILAFKGYKGSAFSVEKDNPLYCSKDGILYSKDLKTLYCVPGNYSDEYLKIDDGVEIINSYAIYDNLNIKFIYISENSLLKEVKKYGILLGSNENLVSFFIDLKNSFTYQYNSFYSEKDISNGNYFIAINDDNLKEEFEEKCPFESSFQRIKVIKEVDIFNKLQNYFKEDRFYTTYSLFNKGVSGDFYSKVDLFKEDVIKNLNYIDFMYSFKGIDDSKLSYFKEFESDFVNFLTFYFEYNVKYGSSITSVKFLNYYLNRYNLFPNEIKEYTKVKYDNLINNFNIYMSKDEIIDIYNLILDFELSNDSFNNEEYIKINNLVNTTYFNSRVIPFEVSDKLMRIETNHDIYELLNKDIQSIDDLVTVDNLIEGDSSDYYLGISGLIDIFFKTKTYKQYLYKYEEYLKYVENYEIIKSDYINSFISEVNELDLTDYDDTKYKKIYEKYNKIYSLNSTMIENNGLIYVEDKINLIIEDINIHTLLNNYSEINYSNLYESYDLAMYIDDFKYRIEDVSSIIQLEEFNTKFDVIKEYLNQFVTKLKEDIKNYEIGDSIDIDSFLDIDYRYDLLGKYAATFIKNNSIYRENEEDSYNYYAKYIKMCIAYNIEYVLSLYPNITYSNYIEANKLLFGFYDYTSIEEYEGINEFINDNLYILSEEEINSLYRYDEYLNLVNCFKELG